MSYILDALNKSEQERIRKSTTPNLPQAPEVRQQEKSSNWMYLYPGVVAMVFVAAATGYYLAKSTADTPAENARPEPVVKAAPAAPAGNERRQPATAKPATATRAAPTADTTGTSSPRHTGTGKATETKKENTAVAAQSPPVVVPVPEEPHRQPTEAELRAEAAAAKEAGGDEVPETFLKMFAENAAAARATADTRPQPQAEVTEQPKVYKPRPPHISELDLSIRNTIPDIEYSAHVYSDNGGSGFVILNGSMRYNGYRVAQDLYVRDILEDGVVLEYRGTKFRLSAMKSWYQYE